MVVNLPCGRQQRPGDGGHMHCVTISNMSFSSRESLLTLTSVPGKPHQSLNFPCPKREFGKTSIIVQRSFQPVHGYTIKMLCRCRTCAHTSFKGKLKISSNADPLFVAKDFTNWKDTTVKFGMHESATKKLS